MEPALKQRLVGAAVLVALAVIFLPLLVQGPAPDSGVADVPLDVPSAPDAGFETRDLPLIGPPTRSPEGGALGMPAPATATPAAPAEAETLPQVVAPPPVATEPEAAEPEATPDATPAAKAPATGVMFPAATAGGDYAVSWGSFSTVASAEASVASLRASQLPAYRDTATVDGKQVQRVRIGPYASRAEAEAARLRAVHVRDDMGATVIALDAAADTPAAPKPKPTAQKKPAATVATGFAVQLAAFSTRADADALVARARSAGFRAFTESVASEQGQLIRVRIGPVSTQAEAEQLQVQVRGRLGIDGIVRPYP